MNKVIKAYQKILLTLNQDNDAVYGDHIPSDLRYYAWNSKICFVTTYDGRNCVTSYAYDYFRSYCQKAFNVDAK